MREIKFRAWNKEEKLMLYDVQNIYDSPYCPAKLSNGENYGSYCGSAFRDVLNNENYEVMQFTGLKDKNGKEIYEGDIIEDVDEDGDCYEVKFFGGGYEIHLPADRLNPHHYCQYLGESMSSCFAVIGNIHSNPELLEGVPR